MHLPERSFPSHRPGTLDQNTDGAGSGAFMSDMEGGAAAGSDAQARLGSGPISRTRVPPFQSSSCQIHARSRGFPLRVAD